MIQWDPDAALSKCLAYIDCQLQNQTSADTHQLCSIQWPAITISRQTGAGAFMVAEHLAAFLESIVPESKCHWTVFDKNLVQKVIEENALPHRFEKYIREEQVSVFKDMIEEMFGLHPNSWTLFHKVSETIYHLAQLGKVIIIGHGANIITSRLENVFHVRLVAPLEQRIKHVQEFYKMDYEQAKNLVHTEDKNRERYIETYFHKRIDDPLLYHMIINTGNVGYDDAAKIIGLAVCNKFQKVFQTTLQTSART